MKNLMKIFSCLAFSLVLVGCVSLPSNAGKRELDLDGTLVMETELGGTVRWYAVDRYNYDDFSLEEIRFQVGYFNDANSLGFVLYGKGAKGETAYFSRQGLELRWDWGSYISPTSGESAYRYSFVIKPDNTGMYYDFSTSKDGTASPRAYYRVHKF